MQNAEEVSVVCLAGVRNYDIILFWLAHPRKRFYVGSNYPLGHSTSFFMDVGYLTAFSYFFNGYPFLSGMHERLIGG